ncbi:MAG: hypothetical protein JWM50_1468 [Microbacteriaceae bacterium]|nr:hypothetical protein [Microbacteriaceae bacterium]
MRIVVVYESIFGNTRQIATAIQRGASEHASVRIASMGSRSLDGIADADLILLGGPTHALGLSTPTTRAEALSWTLQPERHVSLDAGEPRTGIREWLGSHPQLPAQFAAFDTRAASMRHLPGSAARRIDKHLRSRGLARVTAPASFYVSARSALLDGELDRASDWGSRIAALADRALAESSPT